MNEKNNTSKEFQSNEFASDIVYIDNTQTFQPICAFIECDYSRLI